MKKLTLCIAVLLLSACASNKTTREAEIQPPDWFFNPDIPGYVGFAASAPP